jgi:hypothetical protein
MTIKDQFIRYRNNKPTRLKPVTICIAGICNTLVNPTILFCADRLVSAGIQFEGGSSKIIQVTQNCVVMESSNDSPASEMVLESLRVQLKQDQAYTVKQISEMLAKECIEQRRSKLEENVVYRYNLAVNNLKADANVILRDVVNELRVYPYPLFEFIVCGLDNPKEPHIFTVDQDGNIKSWDFLGFATIGSGSELAFSEMTKWLYSDQQPLSLAIPRIYFAKKASERAQGVGKITDYGFLTFIKNPKSDEFIPNAYFISTDQQMIKQLDESYNSIRSFEATTITNMQNEIDKRFKESQKQNSKTENKDTDKAKI